MEPRPDLFGDGLAVAYLVAQTDGAATLVDQLVAVASQMKPLPDDVTVVVLQRKPI